MCGDLGKLLERSGCTIFLLVNLTVTCPEFREYGGIDRKLVYVSKFLEELVEND